MAAANPYDFKALPRSEEPPELGASQVTQKKGSCNRALEINKKTRDDLEYQEYLLSLFKQISDKCLVDLKKEEIGLGMSKLEDCISVLAKVCPKNTETFYKEFSRVIEQVNEVAIWFMKNQNFEKASEVLEKCFEIVKSQPYIFIECFLTIRNNQGCLWKFIGKLNRALIYLQKAENMLERNKDIYNGVTFLNLSVLHAQMGE